MSKTQDLLKAFTKEFGDGIVNQGIQALSCPRIPTGVFPFDYATGGGFPMGRTSILYGPESSMKTSFALKAITYSQRVHPDKKCVFVDAESSYDPLWGAQLGVLNDELVYVLPDLAEQVVDIVEGLLYADDVGVIVVDSLAALTPEREAKNSADTQAVGAAGLLISSFYRRTTRAMASARREGRMPTLIALNQIRHKIGVMHGDPETMPGGNAFKFASSLTVRLYGKDEMDKTVHGSLPAWKKVSGIVKKFKVPVLARNFESWIAAVDNPALQLFQGQSYDLKTVMAYLKQFELLTKGDKGGWALLGEHYQKQDEVKQRFLEDLEFADRVREVIVATGAEQIGVMASDDEDEVPLV